VSSERIQKILSAHGLVSRRGAEKLILEGRVTVNGSVAALGQSAEHGIDDIAVDGVSLTPKGEMVYIMLNKPRGYVTTKSDERGRKTVMDLVQCPAGAYPVGRLDINSEGLLLLTNDGHFAYNVAHPSHNHTKTYEMRVRGDAGKAARLLRRPMEIDSHEVCAVDVRLLEKKPDGGLIRITIAEGRNRQIRKMCGLCGLTVLSLKRVSIGDLGIGGLKPGEWRHLTEDEIKSFIASERA